MARPGVLAIAIVLMALAGCEQQQQAIQQDLPAAHATKALGDVQAIAAAVKIYQTMFSALPDSLASLTLQTTVDGVTGGPFLRAIPAPPAGWSSYAYEKRADGSFAVTAAGEGRTVSAP
jgi:hypothetical protein